MARNERVLVRGRCGGESRESSREERERERVSVRVRVRVRVIS